MAATAQAVDQDRKEVAAWITVGVALVVCLGGLGVSILLVAGGLHGRALSEPVPDGLQTTGTVVDVLSHSDKGTTYRAVLRFTDLHGQTHTFKGREGDEEPEIGEHGRVSYNPGRPGEAHDLRFNHGSWRWPFWTGIFTGTVSLFGLASIVYLLKRPSGHTEGRDPTTQLPDGSLPLTQVIERSRLSPVQKGRLIGLWMFPPVAWVVFPWAGLSLLAPIAFTTAAVLGTIVVISKGRRSHD